MLSNTIKAELAQLRRGTLNLASPLSFEQFSGRMLIDELRRSFPFVFQEHDRGTKHEIGLAGRVSYELEFQAVPGSLFQGVRLAPLLSRCFLISMYDDEISEITWASKIRIRPIPGPTARVGLTFGRGYKLDKTIDGWALTPLLKRETILTEDFLKQRGWQFHVLPPFGITTQVSPRIGT